MAIKELGLTFALGFSLGGGFQSTINRATGQVNRLGKSITELEGKEAFKLGKGLEKFTEKTRSSSRALIEAKKHLAKLKEEEKKSGRTSANLARRIQIAENNVRRFTTGLQYNRRQLRDQVISIQDAGRSLDGLRHDYKGLNDEISRTQRLQNSTAKWAGRGQAVRAGADRIPAMAIAGSLTLVGREAIAFEDAMSDVEKVVDFKTPAGLAAMESGIRNLSEEIPIASAGIADIIAAAGQSGIEKSGLLQFARDAGEMGTAFDLAKEGKDPGKMMSDWRSGMKLSQKQAVSLGDAVNHLSNNMNAEAAAIGEVIQRQGAVAKGAGLSEIQAASLSAALLSSGAPAEIAATALKNLTGALTIGTAASKRQQDAFAALGMDSATVAQSMQEDAEGTIKEVFAALAGLDKAEQGSILTQLFGDESKGAITPLLTNLENFERAFQLTADASFYAGSMHEEFVKKSNNTKSNIQKFTNTLAHMSGNIGQSLLPTLNELIQEVKPWVHGIAEWSKENKEVVKGVAMLGVGLIGLKAGMMVLSPAVGAIGGIIGLVNKFRGRGSGKNGNGRGGTPGTPLYVADVSGGGSGLADLGGGDSKRSKRKSRRSGRGKPGKLGKVGSFFKDLKDKKILSSKVGSFFTGLKDTKFTSFLKGGGKLLGKAAAPLGAAFGMMDIAGAAMSGDSVGVGGAVGETLGSTGGALLGATLGSVVPVVGTAIGGAVGGMLGGWLGDMTGSGITSFFTSEKTPEQQQATDLIAKMDGSSMVAAPASAPINLTVNQTINVPAGSDTSAVKKAMAEANSDLKEQVRAIVEQMFAEQRRLSFG
ncbi:MULTISPECIES: phage tail tape measure protein [unclassified Maridesulfovibrio]|uniref:phage tail tape measure protein n=1 Tax=unclassified Maridesulfovibrio TaxID=2794999 RepID=UPI003B3DD3DF